ncbi:hypothetical protein, partial [Streptococcus pneumoniae]|uniref:hypothetical protein n=1 Tax=Streptococcus pneumoniae TaxID=1313 RepID=UPI001E4F5E45
PKNVSRGKRGVEIMSEKLDLVSLCCRAELETGLFNAYACTECGQACEAIRPDRRPAGFDPDRKEWKRKEPGV